MSKPQQQSISIPYCEVELNGARYFVPGYAANRPAAKRILSGKLYEPQTHRLIRMIFRSAQGSMVHAGTFFGDMIPTFAKAVSGTLWCFEPVIENYILANLSVQRNNLQNVFLMHAALSDKVGMVHMNSRVAGGGHRGGSSFIDAQGVPVPAVALDHFDFADLLVIQLDAEGHELPILHGAVNTIRRFRPLIMVEDNSTTCHPFLAEQGYAEWRRIPGLTIWLHPENAALVALSQRIDAEFPAGSMLRQRPRRVSKGLIADPQH